MISPKLIVTDIDGVWTDGAMYYGEDGSINLWEEDNNAFLHLL